MKLLVALTVVAASLLAYAQPQALSGEIKGIVTDEDGAPVSGATVYAVPQNGFNDPTPRSVKSDSNGSFAFRRLDLNSYKLYARKDDDSYPDPLDKFYAPADSQVPEVDLTPQHASATQTVKLGPQAAVLAGRVVNADTGETIKASLGFVDAEGNGHGISVDGDYRILLPPGKDVTLIVSPLGSRWDRTQVPVAPLRLEPGQYVYMDLAVRQ